MTQHSMTSIVIDGDWLDEQRDLIKRLANSLETMADAARQWERFSGTPDSTTPEIEAAYALVKEARR